MKLLKNWLTEQTYQKIYAWFVPVDNFLVPLVFSTKTGLNPCGLYPVSALTISK